jgi:hypothetical protein
MKVIGIESEMNLLKEEERRKKKAMGGKGSQRYYYDPSIVEGVKVDSWDE